MTLDSVFGSGLAVDLTALPTALDSVFLFVTGVFSFSGAGFVAARDTGLAFDAAAFVSVWGTAFGVGLTADLAVTWVGIFALLAGLAVAVFFTAGFAIDLLGDGLVAAACVFFAVTVGFAGFFIAFAMESIPNWIALVALSEYA